MTTNPFPASAYVALHARRRPDHMALMRGNQCVTFATMARHLRQLTWALADLGMAQGSLIAIGHEDTYLELLLILAAEDLGAVIEMFRPGVGPALPEQVALVVTSMSFPPDRHPPVWHGRVLHIDAAWWRTVLSRPAEKIRPRQAHGADPVRVLHSSGTTGRPKRMLATRAMLDQRIRLRSRLIGLTRTSRCLVTLPLSVAGQYYSVIACLRLGATIVLLGPRTPLQALMELRITHTTLLLFQLQKLLNHIPATATPLPALTLCLIGGRLPPLLRMQALERLCGQIISVYSSNEAGNICAVQPNGEADILPGVELRILAKDGQTLPPGQAGHVQVRGAGVVPGYIEQTLETQYPFPDGWFASGDMGALLPSGRLNLLGRYDDIINLGGIKFACADVEDRILRKLALQDVAVFMQEDDVGRQTLIVCAVSTVGFDLNAGRQTLRSMFTGRSQLRLVDRIPRTPEGKVRRRILRECLSGGCPPAIPGWPRPASAPRADG